MSTGEECLAAGKLAEKSTNFANTCNLLSRYLKHNGNLKDLSPNIAVQLAAKDSSSGRALDLFPQHSGEVTPSKIESINESKSPMTIFYNGQVLVFNDISPQKATKLMSFATLCASSSHSLSPTIPNHNSSEINTMPIKVNNHVSRSSLVSELPMTRTSSLYRFMEKRKERVSTKAPYKVQGRTGLKTSKLKDEDQIQLSL